MKKSSIQEVQGGDIGRSYYVETKERKWFVKYRTDLSSLVNEKPKDWRYCGKLVQWPSLKRILC